MEKAPKPYKFIGFGDIHGPKPYKFIGFGAMDATKPYKFIGFGAMDANGAVVKMLSASEVPKLRRPDQKYQNIRKEPA